jgi:hypothetical protein
MKEQTGKYSLAKGHMLKSISVNYSGSGLKGAGFITFRNNSLNEISHRENLIVALAPR